MFPFDDVIMVWKRQNLWNNNEWFGVKSTIANPQMSESVCTIFGMLGRLNLRGDTFRDLTSGI